jgi:hypothetical protein
MSQSPLAPLSPHAHAALCALFGDPEGCAYGFAPGPVPVAGEGWLVFRRLYILDGVGQGRDNTAALGTHRILAEFTLTTDGRVLWHVLRVRCDELTEGFQRIEKCGVLADRVAATLWLLGEWPQFFGICVAAAVASGDQIVATLEGAYAGRPTPLTPESSRRSSSSDDSADRAW